MSRWLDGFLLLRYVAASLIFCAIGTPCFAQLGSTAPRTWVLLVGVTNYPQQDRFGALQGPRNDVKLMFRTLVQSLRVPTENITVLADSVDQGYLGVTMPIAGAPTQSNIIAAFNDLVAKVRPADRIIIFMAGHGSQLPERVGAARLEVDGRDEVFLPVDIGTWNEDSRSVDNELRDDDIAAQLEKLVNGGANVWLIVDACHSGTLSRNASAAVARSVAPEALGVPASAFQVPSVPSGEAPRTADLFIDINPESQPASRAPGASRGRFVGFFAALPDQRAFEVPFSSDEPGGKSVVHGIMTMGLARTLRENPGATYEELALRIRMAYRDNGKGGRGAAESHPMFQGDLEGQPFPELGAAGQRLLRLDEQGGRLFIPLGQINGIADGTKLELRNGKIQRDPPLLGMAKVTNAGVERSEISIEPVAKGQDDALLALAHKQGASSVQDWLTSPLSLGYQQLVVRVVDRTTPFDLKIATADYVPSPDENTSAEDRAAAATTRAVIDQLLAMPPRNQSIALTATREPDLADVVIVAHRGRVWFPDHPGAFQTTGPGQPPSIPIAGLTADKLGASLRTIGRANNLLRVATRFAGSNAAASLKTEVFVEPTPLSADGTCPAPKGGETKALPETAVGFAHYGYTTSDVMPVNHCDTVFIRFTNAGQQALDLTALYINPWSAIFHLDNYDDSDDRGMRLMPGTSRILSYREDTNQASGLSAVGPVTIAVLAVPADPDRYYAASFSYLAQSAVTSPEQRSAAAKALPAGLRGLIDAAGFGNGQVRSGKIKDDGKDAGAVVLSFRTTAPESAVKSSPTDR